MFDILETIIHHTLNNSNDNFCKNNCGYFSSPQFDGFCSICFKESQPGGVNFHEASNEHVADSYYEQATLPAPSQAKAVIKQNLVEPVTVEKRNTESKRSQRNKCNICNKRVGLTGFECHCGGLFCSTHRYPNEHSCDYDFQEAGRLQLTKENPVVNGEKVKKI